MVVGIPIQFVYQKAKKGLALHEGSGYQLMIGDLYHESWSIFC